MVKRLGLLAFLKRNWIGILGLVIGLTGFIASIYIYNSTKNFRDPIFIVDPVRSYIVDSDQLSEMNFVVIDSFGTQITSNLTSIRFYFWNNGNSPIKQEHILKDIIIVIDDTISEIIDWKFINISRDVTKLWLDGYNRNEIQINFSILESNDGGTGQIIYEGDPNANIYIKGIIEGVETIRTNVPIPYKKLLITYVIYLGMVFLMILGSLKYPNYLIRLSRNRKVFRKIRLVTILVLIIVLISSLMIPLLIVKDGMEENLSAYILDDIKPKSEFLK